MAAALGAAIFCAAAPLFAQSPAAQAATEAPPPPPVPLSPTSQCVEGPGAPPADPSKPARLAATTDAHGKPVIAEEPAIDEAPAGGPAPVLLELGLLAGASVRVDDPPFGLTTRRLGLMLGGSIFAWPTRSWALGLTYTHADLSRSESPPGSTDTVLVEHGAHALFADVRVVPFRLSGAAFYGTLGAGLAWQTASLRATLPPVNGDPGASIACDVGGGADFAFRAGIGSKIRLTRAAAVLLEADFMGYRFGSEVQGNCAPGAGTAQTLMLRAGVTYDIDVSRLVR